MTELDSTMPDGNSLPPASLQVSATENKESINAAISNEPQLKEQQNGNNSAAATAKSLEPMEVDGVDTEEDDSQITTSTENSGGGGEDSKMSDDVPKPATPLTSTENSKESLEADSSAAVKEATPTPATSLNACDDDSQNCNVFPEKTGRDESRDSTSSLAKHTSADNEKDEGSKLSGKQPTDDTDPLRQEGIPKTNVPSNDNETPMNTVEAEVNEKACISQAESKNAEVDPLPIEVRLPKASATAIPQKENGLIGERAHPPNDTSIVDLGDDTDEEMGAVPMKNQATPENAKNGEGPTSQMTQNKTDRSVCSDSDGAVVIGSDSENEESQEAPVAQPKSASRKFTPQVIEDDDDDCVVIEDDTPAPDAASDLSKRKINSLDAANNSDDSQPPSKRQRSGVPQGNANLSQITIKDARSLLPAQEVGTKRLADGGIYPVNITPAPGMGVQGPPKLVAMASATNLPLPGLAGLSSNANLLPGLTDDMFVLEAPSFIVPYIYEKPPGDNLRDVVRDIESKCKLSRDDLAEADKSDEFDMITEQNKDDKEEKDDKNGKKRKKRRGRDDGDESWSEESDEDEDDEDDDDSESGMRTKVLIKEASDDLTVLKGAIKPPATVVHSTDSVTPTTTKLGQDNYFESPLGKFFMDIGVGLVQEFVQSDLIRLQKRKMRKSLGKNITEFERAIAALSGNLDASRKKNTPFKFTMKRCEFCNFKSESALAMANHYETPHMNGPLYKCNFCIFEIRNATEIVYHMEAVHNIKARLIKPLPYHQCPNCGFEDNGKAKLARHQPVCAKKFRPELNLAPPNDWEAPAKIPRIKPRHGLVGTATAYQAMAAQAAAQKAALASIQQQQQVAQARSLQAAALAAQNAAKIRGRPPVMNPKGAGPNAGSVLRGPNQVRSPMATNVVLPNNYQLAGGQLIQTANALAKKSLSGQPSISITPLPRQSASPQASSPSTSKMPPAGMKPGQNPGGGNKNQFVICEICDGYIKDLEQLRNHMQWMHKVKIHPKMIYNRPPLNCQKCQFRFFTDQGLERHLLGSHGLVTSSMQEAANKGKDAGRCPVCGRMYQWKLLNHVSRDHHMTLKPAHLSYKCTVCTATFGMYKQFETHVYTAHSTVAKKAMDGKKNTVPIGNPAGSSNIQRNNLGVSNDSLLKPLKINDEITIIPQPATKPRITNMESHIID